MKNKEKRDPFDFWYAVNHTEIVHMPARRLETFGSTVINYHMISELMDTVNQTRVREGRIQAYRPQIITPLSYANNLLEGFGQEAEKYVEWLREHAQDMHILRYGFAIRKEETNVHIITDSVKAVTGRVCEDAKIKDDPLAAIVVGVEQPWEVCLLKLMVEVIRNSAPGNVREFERHRLLENVNGAPKAVRDELEADFAAAGRDARLVKALGRKLRQYGLFQEYEDRFFALVKASGAS